MALNLPEDEQPQTPADRARSDVKTSVRAYRRVSKDLGAAHRLMCAYRIKIDTDPIAKQLNAEAEIVLISANTALKELRALEVLALIGVR